MTLLLNKGFSREAKYLDESALESLRPLEESNTFGIESILQELESTWAECREPNWDGYGANPIDAESFSNAHKFLRALPLGNRPSSVGADPDGAITFEWYHSRRRRLSVSIEPDGKLHYAALLGKSETYGTEDFQREVPDIILQLIWRVDVE